MKSEWPTVQLSEVLTPAAREEQVNGSKEYRLLGVRLDGHGPFLRETVAGTQTSARKLFRVANGDFIYSRLFAWRGALGVIDDQLDGCYVSGEFPAFVPVPDRIDARFLDYWFRIRSTLDKVAEDCTGSTPLTRNRFKEEYFLALEISLPPLPEQRRIVERIEELTAQIAEARALRRETVEEVEALLVSGLGKAYQLSVKAFGRSPIGSFAEVKGGKRLPAGERLSNERTPFPYIRVSDMENHSVSLSNLKYVPERLEPPIARYIVRSSDVYVTIAGTIGYPGTIPDELDNANLTENAARLVFTTPNEIEKRFVVYMLRSPQAQEAFRQKRTIAAQPKLALHRIASTEIPLPPLREQRRIVAELDALQAEVDQLKDLQAETGVELDALLPSILDRAFRGEL